MATYIRTCRLRRPMTAMRLRRLHSWLHHRKLGRGAWKASRVLASPCEVTADDVAWVKRLYGGTSER